MIYHRFIPTGKLLKEYDYIRGFGIDSDLVLKIRRERNKRGYDAPERLKYDNRKGFAIDMAPFNNQYHPMFENDIIDLETGKQLQIDGYYRNNFYGYHWVILAKDKDTNSHRTILWENETCHEPGWLDDIKENQKKYKLVPASNNRWKNGKCID